MAGIRPRKTTIGCSATYPLKKHSIGFVIFCKVFFAILMDGITRGGRTERDRSRVARKRKPAPASKLPWTAKSVGLQRDVAGEGEVAEHQGDKEGPHFEEPEYRHRGGGKDRQLQRPANPLARVHLKQDLPGDLSAVEGVNRQQIEHTPGDADEKELVEQVSQT